MKHNEYCLGKNFMKGKIKIKFYDTLNEKFCCNFNLK